MVRAWAIPVAYLLMAATQVVVAFRFDGVGRALALVFAVALVALAFYFRPRRLSEASYADAAVAAHAGRVVIYHRPGCVFCARLIAALGRPGRERAVWVNIWRDPEAADYVRSVNDGNETVPTVVIDGVAHTNPAPGQVKAALAR